MAGLVQPEDSATMPSPVKKELIQLIQDTKPQLEKAFRRCDWLFLSLTIKNCTPAEQQKIVAKMDYGFTKLTKHKGWPALGWIKTIKAHEDRALRPIRRLYIQSLLVMEPQFFNITPEEWSDMWKKALKIDYSPITHSQLIEPTNNKSATYTALTYVFSHMLKEGIFHKSLRLSTGGCLADINKFLDNRVLASTQ